MRVSSSASVESERLESEILGVGRAIASGQEHHAHGLRRLDEKGMQLATHDRELRAALFRLVDVTPACRTLDDVGRHLAAFLDEVDGRTPAIDAAMRVSHTRAGRVALGAAAAAGVRRMAHRFIVGESPEAAIAPLARLWRSGIAASVDLLGEATVTEPEADRYAARCARALDALSAAASRWDEQPLLERDELGPIPRVNLSVKVSALTPLIRPGAPERALRDAAERFRPLLRRARELGAHLHVDMESLDSRETTLGLVLEVVGEEEFREGPSVGVVVQAYLRDSPAELESLSEWAARAGRRPPLTVRLVKGAYWDHELVEARQHGWSVPVFTDKAECDRNFEELTRRLLQAAAPLRPAIASHNLRSLAHAIAFNRLAGRPDARLELQVLRGLGDDLARALAGNGFRVRVYSPVGDLVAGMAYLVRRLLENTSNESFLAAQAEGAAVEELLAPP